MASTESTTGKKLSMKLLVHSKTQRVLYAEAGKDVIDLLFAFALMAVSSAVNIFTTESMVRSIGNLYSSIDKIDRDYSLAVREMMQALTPAAGCPAKLPQLPEPESGDIFRCAVSVDTACYNSFTKVSGTPCPSCKNGMVTKMQLVEPAAGSVGGAQLMYTITDDLKVAPMSSISVMKLLKAFGITDIGSLKEKTLQIGADEASQILTASLKSKTVLTDVFLAKNRK